MPRNIGVCLVLLLVSYLASGFTNASPVTHPRLVGPRSHTVIVRPYPFADGADPAVEFPASQPEIDFQRDQRTQSL